jgi:hypothetical protein
MVKRENPLTDHLFQISQAQGVAKIPVDTKQDDRWLKVLSFKHVAAFIHTG